MDTIQIYQIHAKNLNWIKLKSHKPIRILVLLSAKGLEIWYVWKVLDVDLYKIIINIIKSVMSSIAYISNDFTVTVLTTPAVSPEFRVHSLYLTFEVTGIKCCYENFHSNTWMLYEPHHWVGYFPLLLSYWLLNCCCHQRYVLTWRCIVQSLFYFEPSYDYVIIIFSLL